jgi:MFS family permease
MAKHEDSQFQADPVIGPDSDDPQAVGGAETSSGNIFYRLYTDPWFQIVLISMVCFCCPGMYNALTGMGGGGQVDPTVAANSAVALLSTGAVVAMFIAGPVYDLIGSRWSLLIGGWTYALYSGSLLNYNLTQNAGFVIGSGALLGIGAAFLWIPQGVIMTTYPPEKQRGRAIALFWIIFNLGGGIGSLASFGINYNSTSGTVTNSTYIAYLVIMLFGWLIGFLFVCPPSKLNTRYHGERISHVQQEYEKLSVSKVVATAKFAFHTLIDWKLLVLLPMFFYANIFYSYQQNSVNGATFNIRTRALNSSLYWIAQMFGGFAMGGVLDINSLHRKYRAMIGWVILLVVGCCIWGGGYKFQVWNDNRTALGLKQDIDFKDKEYIGPMFLYIFYGMYDALWQGYCYWMIGAKSNSPAVSGILVGAYKTCQSCGGALSWRVNAVGVSAMRQLAMNWGLTVGTLAVAIPAVLTVSYSNEEPEVNWEKTDENALE